MSEDKQYGLNIDEQAFSMWITCRFNTNPEICAAHIIGGLEAKCPFECKCDEVDQEMWVEFLNKRETPCKTIMTVRYGKLMVEYQYFGGQWYPIQAPKEPTP